MSPPLETPEFPTKRNRNNTESEQGTREANITTTTYAYVRGWGQNYITTSLRPFKRSILTKIYQKLTTLHPNEFGKNGFYVYNRNERTKE